PPTRPPTKDDASPELRSVGVSFGSLPSGGASRKANRLDFRGGGLRRSAHVRQGRERLEEGGRENHPRVEGNGHAASHAVRGCALGGAGRGLGPDRPEPTEKEIALSPPLSALAPTRSRKTALSDGRQRAEG